MSSLLISQPASMASNCKNKPGSVILMTHGQKDEMSTIRLDRVPQDQLGQCPVYHVTEGPFKGVAVKQTVDEGDLATVGKPHVRTWFYAHIRNRTTNTEETSRERRELSFWFRKKTTKAEQISQTTEYFKRIIEPETFPKDYVSFIKKAMLLMQRYPLMRRVQLTMCIEPEPIDESDTYSILPESLQEEPPIENFITVLTPAVYDYQYLPEVPVSRKTHVSFRILAAADAHIALSHVYGDTDRRTYEIVLGGWNNTKSVIRYGGRGPVQVEAATPGLLNAEDFQCFWISWSDGCVQVGRGMTKGVNCFLQWMKIPPVKLHTINLMSVSTGPGSDGRWEFVEYIAPTSALSETKAAKRDKVRRAVVWYAKKAKMLENMDEAFPSCLNTKQLLRLSQVRLTDMLEAVVFLKDLLKLGFALEVSRGTWLRAPSHRLDPSHEVKIVQEMPRFPIWEAPTVALVTSLHCEKQAIDTVIDNKVSYVVHSVNSQTGKEKTVVYTLGHIGDHKVVSMKLSKVYTESGTRESHAEAIDKLIALFEQLQHIILVGTGGGVPHYTNYEKHVKRGDIAVSVPRSSDSPLYIHCTDVEQGSPGEEPFFSTSVWNAADDAIAKAVRQLYDLSVARSYEKRSWEKYSEQSQDQLKLFDDRFYRPPAKTDRLFALLKGEKDPIHVRHPVPPPDKQYAYRENAPNVRFGPIACGRAVSRNDTLRMDFASCHGIIAYDRELHHVVEAVMNSRVSSFAVVLGICDYADGTKTRTWHPYASVCAAAFTKSLLLALPVSSRRRSSFYP